jgi:hypothetical protein
VKFKLKDKNNNSSNNNLSSQKIINTYDYNNIPKNKIVKKERVFDSMVFV